jgi:hypothetical protein
MERNIVFFSIMSTAPKKRIFSVQQFLVFEVLFVPNLCLDNLWIVLSFI